MEVNNYKINCELKMNNGLVLLCETKLIICFCDRPSACELAIFQLIVTFRICIQGVL